MRKPGTLNLSAATAMLLALTGCASKLPPAPVECPRFVPSPEALQPMPEPDWRGMASRLVRSSKP